MHLLQDTVRGERLPPVGCCAVTNPTPPEILDHAEKFLIDSNVPEADHRQKLNDAAKVTI